MISKQQTGATYGSRHSEISRQTVEGGERNAG